MGLDDWDWIYTKKEALLLSLQSKTALYYPDATVFSKESIDYGCLFG